MSNVVEFLVAVGRDVSVFKTDIVNREEDVFYRQPAEIRDQSNRRVVYPRDLLIF